MIDKTDHSIAYVSVPVGSNKNISKNTNGTSSSINSDSIFKETSSVNHKRNKDITVAYQLTPLSSTSTKNTARNGESSRKLEMFYGGYQNTNSNVENNTRTTNNKKDKKESSKHDLLEGAGDSHKQATHSGQNNKISAAESSRKLIQKPDAFCKHSPLYQNYSLLYGIKAGNFTFHGKTKDIEACLHQCCHEENCKLALVISQKCYTLACIDKYCSIVPARSTIHKPTVVFVSRTSGMFVRQMLTFTI